MFSIDMHPGPTSSAGFRASKTMWQVRCRGKWLADFDDPDHAQVFVNALTYIEEVKACGHLDAYPAYEYLLRNTT